METTLHLIRHGKTYANDKEYICSKLPGSELNQLGIEQSKNLGKDIESSDYVFDAIYISPFQRTIRTFTYANEETKRRWFKKAPIITHAIKELDYGEYSGENPNIKPDNLIKTLERIDKGDYQIRFGVYGESEIELLVRIYKFLIDQVESPDQNIALFTHQCACSVIHKVYREINPDAEKPKVENAKIYKIKFKSEDVKHLKKLLAEVNQKDIAFTNFLLHKNGVSSLTKFHPSVDLPIDKNITTPLTFAFDENKNVMLTLDKNDWWNPLGGHIEKNETWKETLARESIEEAGTEIQDIEIAGYIEVKRLTFDAPSKYPDISILPITASKIKRIEENWKKAETKDRKLVTIDRAKKLLLERDDNKQIYEIFNYIVTYLL